MRKLRAVLVRLVGMFRKERRERELAQELESHLQFHIEDNLRAGMTPEQARRQALISLGGLERTKERWGEHSCRGKSGWPRWRGDSEPRLWERKFAADPTVVGKTIEIDGQTSTVIGVTPSWFNLWIFGAQAWTPLAFDPKEMAASISASPANTPSNAPISCPPAFRGSCTSPFPWAKFRSPPVASME